MTTDPHAGDHHDIVERGLDLGTLARRYESAEIVPTDVVRAVLARVRQRGDDGVWISLASEERLLVAARNLEARRLAGERLPLYGIPFGVKDNIDVAGLPTTAACPAFSYAPPASAFAVERLEAAGGLVIGKTNLDQFATGLVGVRSPFGLPRNAFNADYVAGGSSSGSALAVALGEVAFTLGTDTAGSGRVPAAFNNVVGLKPSPGVISTAGVVPACRSLDCISVFASTCEDAAAVAELMRGFNPADPFSRPTADSVAFVPALGAGARAPASLEPFRFGVPRPVDRDFLGDARAAVAFERAVECCLGLGGAVVEVDLAPFLETGRLLYDGPFVAQRLQAAGRLLAERPESLLPPIRTILEGATRCTAQAAFDAEAQLVLLRRQISSLWPTVDFILMPTAPTIPRIDAVQQDPLHLNTALGRYTTFVNLLDLAALAVPTGLRDDRLPAGVTLMGPWGSDARLAAYGTRIHRDMASHVGATSLALPPPLPAPKGGPAPASTTSSPPIEIAVAGAHLSGEPLNHQLTSLGATIVRECRTAPHYRLFAIPGTVPPKPGLIRIGDGDGVGASIEVEVWRMSPAAFGAFVAAIPAPLGVGKVQLEDGQVVSGFLCEFHATVGAVDISSFGGWRAFQRSRV